MAMNDHVRAAYAIIKENLAVDVVGFSTGFRELLEQVFGESIRAQGDPSWLGLPILTCEALGGDVVQAQHVAAALEIGRIAAGCLDEWQDQDTDNALWREIGAARTVNLAVGMIGLSFLTLGRMVDHGTAADTVLQLKREFELGLVRMSEGQHEDLGDNLTIEDYETVAAAKSGTLFRLGCRAGAIVAEAEDDVIDLYGEFGHNLGILIQMWNDFEGLAGLKGKADAKSHRGLLLVAAQSLGTGDYNPLSAEGQAGVLYGLLRLQTYYEKTGEALDNCPSAGGLSAFLEAYSPQRLAERASENRSDRRRRRGRG